MKRIYNIDIQKIADELDFDLEDVEMLLEVFLESANNSLVKLEEAIKINDIEGIIHTSHSIKGSAANLTLINISEIAKEIEYSARETLNIDYQEKYKILEKFIKSI